LTAESNLSMYGVGLAVPCREVLEAQHNVGGVFADAGEIHEGNGHEGEAYLNSLKKQKAGAKPESYNFSFPKAMVNRVFCGCNSLQNETLQAEPSAARYGWSGGVEGLLLRRSARRIACVVTARKFSRNSRAKLRGGEACGRKIVRFCVVISAMRRRERSAVGAPTLCPPGKRKLSF